MARLSSTIDHRDLKSHFDVLVVGSGYGGAITASRAARAGKKVCVLERGKEFQAGEFPDTELRACEELQIDAPETHIGPKTGLYDFRVNPDLNVFLGCGLGGTSLVNANVSLCAEPRVFADEAWPEAIRKEAEKIGSPEKPRLELGYELARQMLEPTAYPDGFPALAKLGAQSESAQAMGAKFYRTPINVTFEDHINFAGVEQKKCVKCGDCVTGCNHSAKNTVLMNYLPDAKHWGARIFTQTSVRYLDRRENKWFVYFELLGYGREKFNGPDLFVTADLVVLGAGALGSTEILLRSQQRGLPISNELGKHFSGNGDVLGFSYNGPHEINAIGYGHRDDLDKLEPVGPCITGIIDLRNQTDLEAGMVIEEGSIPGALAHLMPAAFQSAAITEEATGVAIPPYKASTREKIDAAARELESLLLGSYKGAVHNTQIYLVMTHDGSDGQMYLENDRLRIRWPGVGSRDVFSKVGDQLRAASKALEGTFLSNPIWSEFLRHELITVHPLGGCAMADSHRSGVVNDRGQVFDTRSENSVWPGLYVNDGAVIPRSLGVNPLLTISALAERCCMLMAGDYNWKIDYGKKQFAIPTEVAKLGIEFTERMAGFFSTKVKDDYKKGAAQGKLEQSSLEFVLTIGSDDMDAMLASPRHEASTEGTVIAPMLSGKPISCEGSFELFVQDPAHPETRNMLYSMPLETEEGAQFFFQGFKVINDSSILQAWEENTTLFVTVYKGSNATGDVVGKGILRISVSDFSKQLNTIKITNAGSLAERAKAIARFGEFFAGVLWHSYGGIFSKQSFFKPEAPPRRKRPLRVGAPEIHGVKTSDQIELRLTRYRGGDLGPVLLVHGLGVSSLIFSIDTIETNLLEFLYVHGFDVWLLDFRASIDLPASNMQFSGDDVATRDYPAAVAKVRELTGSPTVQIVAHCFGSTTFCMAMLAGLDGVRSAVCSQIAAHIIAPEATQLKTGFHLPDFLDKLGIRSLTAAAQADENWLERLYDRALRLYPLEESCHNPVCRRIAFMYAPLYHHAQLNDATHEAMHEMFGTACITAFEHLGRMTRAGHLVDATGRDSYMPNLKRLAIPISFIHGAENECFLPLSTQITYDALRKENGTALYERHLIPGYGHIDCIFGKSAAVDVFPFILDHLEANRR